jgi:hypothetical protein
MTFLEIIQKQGYQSINEYLEESASFFNVKQAPDFSREELKAIRRAERATEAYLEVVA